MYLQLSRLCYSIEARQDWSLILEAVCDPVIQQDGAIAEIWEHAKKNNWEDRKWLVFRWKQDAKQILQNNEGEEELEVTVEQWVEKGQETQNW